MEYLWNIYGISMEYLWNIMEYHGISREYLGNINIYAISLEYRRVFLENLWKNVYEMSMKYIWNIYGILRRIYQIYLGGNISRLSKMFWEYHENIPRISRNILGIS